MSIFIFVMFFKKFEFFDNKFENISRDVEEKRRCNKVGYECK